MPRHRTSAALAALGLLTLTAAPTALASEEPDIPARPPAYVSDQDGAIPEFSRGILENYLEQINTDRPQNTWVYITDDPQVTNTDALAQDIIGRWEMDDDDILLIVNDETGAASLHVGPKTRKIITDSEALQIADIASQRTLGGETELGARTAASQIDAELRRGTDGTPSTPPDGPAPGATVHGEGDYRPETQGDLPAPDNNGSPAPEAAPSSAGGTTSDATSQDKGDGQAEEQVDAQEKTSTAPTATTWTVISILSVVIIGGAIALGVMSRKGIL